MGNEFDVQAAVLDELVNYAQGLGVDAERGWWHNENGEEDRSNAGFAVINVPNGRSKRRFRVSPGNAPTFAALPLDQITLLGDLQAFADRSTGVIEAKVVDSRGMPAHRLLSAIPGAAAQTDAEGEGEDERGKPPRVVLHADDGRWLEIGDASPAAQVLLGPARVTTTIRLHGAPVDRHDQALEALTEISGSLFFDLDVLYNLSLSLSTRRPLSSRQARIRSGRPPAFPANKYSEKALALYRYGRSAQGLPLLEYLAYYQSLEYFFPSFSHAETSAAMRTLLLDPRFDPADDADVSKLINTAAPAVRAGIGEREQLKSTLRSVLRVEDLRDTLKEIDAGEGYFTRNKQSIAGTAPIRLADQDLREQLAERIYTIRCRIVHSKDNGGPSGEELLLPTSPEAGNLGPDIALLRYVAQQAIIAQAQR